jgi:hypothetical protein
MLWDIIFRNQKRHLCFQNFTYTKVNQVTIPLLMHYILVSKSIFFVIPQQCAGIVLVLIVLTTMCLYDSNYMSPLRLAWEQWGEKSNPFLTDGVVQEAQSLPYLLLPRMKFRPSFIDKSRWLKITFGLKSFNIWCKIDCWEGEDLVRLDRFPFHMDMRWILLSGHMETQCKYQ